MNAASRDSIDQALFGYADGHRQIASSVRLPPKDLFLLSSASDLASGARLGEQDSYLSGLPLPESRRYALFRTWAAPEMPRPGLRVEPCASAGSKDFRFNRRRFRRSCHSSGGPSQTKRPPTGTRWRFRRHRSSSPLASI